MRSYVLHKLHSVMIRVVHLAHGVLSWLRQSLVRVVAFIKNTVFTVFLMTLLAGCHVNRHVVTHVDDARATLSGHREQSTSSRLDSLFSQLTASADSITIVLYDHAFPSTVMGGCTSTLPCGYESSLQGNVSATQPDTATGTFPGVMCAHPPEKARITIHSPRVNKEVRSGSNSKVETNVADSTRSNTESHTSTDDSKETIGGAEPPNLTGVFIVLGLGITLLLIGAIFGYLLLHKKGLL